MDGTREAKTEAVRIARDLLEGRIELVAGCQAVQRPLRTLGLREDDDFTVFMGVDSEADALPSRMGPDAQAFNSHYRPYVEDACRKLIARLG